MKLWYSPSSPFARKCMVVAHEVGIADKIELLNFSGTPVARDERVIESNPLGKIPCMLLDDGASLFDSRVICTYLDTRHDKDSLILSGDRRFDGLVCEALGDGLLDAAVGSRYEVGIRPKEKQWDKWLEGQFQKIDSGLDHLETWKNACLEDVHMGSIAVVCTLGYLDFRHPTYDWRASHPYLREVYASWEKRPSMIETHPAK